MTMYLPNGDIRPTGYEAGEFLEAPTVAPMVEPPLGKTDVGDEDDDQGGLS
jgi:hypothetical protein